MNEDNRMNDSLAMNDSVLTDQEDPEPTFNLDDIKEMDFDEVKYMFDYAEMNYCREQANLNKLRNMSDEEYVRMLEEQELDSDDEMDMGDLEGYYPNQMQDRPYMDYIDRDVLKKGEDYPGLQESLNLVDFMIQTESKYRGQDQDGAMKEFASQIVDKAEELNMNIDQSMLQPFFSDF